MTQPPAERPEFMRRVVRIIAGITLAYAALNLAQSALYLLIRGSLWGYSRGNLVPFERAIMVSSVANMILLLAGWLGLRGWKRWSRPAVMWWAVLSVVLSFATSALWFVQYTRDIMMATTQVAMQQPVWQQMLWQILWFLENMFFPLLIWLLLWQPEVAKLFERVASGGFEVLPYARAATNQDASLPPNG
jgi:hypothetical protein